MQTTRHYSIRRFRLSHHFRLILFALLGALLLSVASSVASPQPAHATPAWSTGVALFVGDWALAQLWLFWVAPIVGAVLGAVVYRFLAEPESVPAPEPVMKPTR